MPLKPNDVTSVIVDAFRGILDIDNIDDGASSLPILIQRSSCVETKAFLAKLMLTGLSPLIPFKNEVKGVIATNLTRNDSVNISWQISVMYDDGQDNFICTLRDTDWACRPVSERKIRELQNRQKKEDVNIDI